MSNQLLEKLEQKIENAIELIELLRLQIEDLEEKNVQLQSENNKLKQSQTHWEQTLNTLMRKLDNAHVNSDKVEMNTKKKSVGMEHIEEEMIEDAIIEDAIV